MREIAVGAIALLVGLVIGGFGPRAELNRMMQTVESVDAERCKNTFGEDLATFFGGAREGGLPLVDLPGGDSRPPVAVKTGGSETEVEAALEELRAEEAAAKEELTEEARAALQDSEELELARSALELRQAQAREAMVQSLELDDSQTESMDMIYGHMNETLEVMAGGLADMVLSGEEPDRRTAMGFAAEALDAMIVAEENALAELDDEQRSMLEDDVLNPFNHVSPNLIDHLLELDSGE